MAAGEGTDKAGNPVVIGPVTRLFVRRARTIALTTCSISILCTIIGILFASQGFSYALNAYKIQSSRIVQQADALAEVRSEQYTAPDDKDDDAEEEDDDDRTREFTIDSTTLVYEALGEGGNMLTMENVLKMAQVEGAILETDWEDNCVLAYKSDRKEEGSACASPTTILNYLYRNDKLHKEQCKDGFCQVEDTDVCGTFVKWGEFPCRSRIYDWRQGELASEKDWPDILDKRLCGEVDYEEKFLLDKNATCDSEEPVVSRHLRSSYGLGWPLEGFKNRQDRPGEQFTARTWFSSGPRSSYGGNLKTALAEEINDVSATQTTDRFYATRPQGGKTISVTYSNFTSLKIFDVLFVDVAWAVFSVLFVFCYIWYNVSSIMIAIAGIFEIVISLPLAFFFWRVVMWQQEVELLQFLSIYLILCIGADDIFVWYDMWRASAREPEAVSGSEATRFAWTYSQSVGAMSTTTATTCFCLLTTAFSNIPAVSAFGIFTGLVVFFDYLLVITWLPAMTLLYARHFEAKCAHKLCGCCAVKCCSPPGKPGEPIPERTMVRFLRVKVVPLLAARRWIFVGGTLALTAVIVAAGANIATLAEGFPDDFPPTHPDQVVNNLQRYEFLVADDWVHQVTVVYGLDNQTALTYEEDAQIYPAFGTEVTLNQVEEPWGPAAQEAIVWNCRSTRKNSTLVINQQGYCILEDLARARGDFPYPNERALREALEGFYESTWYAYEVSEASDYVTNTGFMPDGKNGITAIWVTYNTTIPKEVSNGPLVLGPYYRMWTRHTDKQCKTNCFHMLPQINAFDAGRATWVLFDFLRELVANTAQSIGYSLLCALVILLIATRNWLVTLLVVSTIVCIVATVLCLIFLVGFDLGVYECIYTVLTIGLSIDYSVHVSHFYNEADGTRMEKAEASVVNIGVSVLGGAATTAFCGLPLFICVTSFLSRYGYFICFTSLVSIVYTFTLFVPLLMICGPQGDFGRVVLLDRLLGGGHASGSKVKADKAEMDPIDPATENHTSATNGHGTASAETAARAARETE